MNKSAGWVLILIGLAVLIWGAFGFTTRDKVLDVGPIHATKETKHDVPYAPIIAVVLVVGGVGLLFTGRKA